MRLADVADPARRIGRTEGPPASAVRRARIHLDLLDRRARVRPVPGGPRPVGRDVAGRCDRVAAGLRADDDLAAPVRLGRDRSPACRRGPVRPNGKRHTQSRCGAGASGRAGESRPEPDRIAGNVFRLAALAVSGEPATPRARPSQATPRRPNLISIVLLWSEAGSSTTTMPPWRKTRERSFCAFARAKCTWSRAAIRPSLFRSWSTTSRKRP